eukprot:6942516-Ditylum_brightwellii.AAC.1
MRSVEEGYGLSEDGPDYVRGDQPPSNQAQQTREFNNEEQPWWDNDARPILPKVSFFMGDLRDGLAM